MDVLKRYDIPFKGLDDGVHSYTFTADNELFASFEHTPLKGGEVTAEVTLRKSSSVLSLDFTITGSAVTECDRCLADCTLPVEYEGTLVVRPSETGEEEYDGEILWLPQSETTVNLAQYIYESVVLGLPMQRLHRNGQSCDPDMLARFSVITGEQEAALEEAAGVQKLADSPEMEKLRALRDKMNEE